MTLPQSIHTAVPSQALSDPTVEPTLVHMMQQLYGASATLTTAVQSVESIYRFFAVTNHQGQFRWIIPQQSQWGLSVLQQWQPYGLLSRSQWQGWLALYRTGFHSLPKTQSFGVVNGRPLWQALQHQYGGENAHWVPVVYVGTPCQVQKLVVTLVDSVTHHPVAVLKTPLGANAWPCIQQEATLLQTLGTHSSGVAPKLLTLSEEHQCSVQQFVPGKLANARLEAAYIHWLLALPKQHGRVTLGEHIDETVHALVAVASVSSDVVAQFTQLLNRIIHTSHTQSLLPRVIQHGDFVPWNLKKTTANHLMALDWEAGRLDGVPFYDVIHFQGMLNYSQGKPIGDLFDLLENEDVRFYLDKLSVSLETARVLIYTYVVNQWLHHVYNDDLDYAQRYYEYVAPLLNL